MIEELIKEMFTECHVCQGSGQEQKYNEKEDDYYETDCVYCDQTGEVLTCEAEKLIYIINNGRKL